MFFFRTFFSNFHWWGKILGALFGYLMTRSSVGIIVGIIIGNFFDRALKDNLNRSKWHVYLEKSPEIQRLFLKTTFSVMGHIAKADGRISENVIREAQNLMLSMRLTKAQKLEAQQAFQEGKSQDFNMSNQIIKFRRDQAFYPDLLQAFIEIQYKMAQVDRLTPKKITLLNQLLIQLGLAPLNRQERFYEDFNTNNYSHNTHNRQHHYSYESKPQNNIDSVAEAHAILGTNAMSTESQVKTAYRRLISQNHPDKLIARKASEDEIKVANNKTQVIRKAYERICENKGW